MLPTRVFTLLTVFLFAFIPLSFGQDIDQWIDQLGSDNAQARIEAAKQLSTQGPDVIAPLFEVMQQDNPTATLWAKNALKELTYQAGDETESNRQAIAEAFLAVVESDADRQAKQFAYHKISLLNVAENVVRVLRGKLKVDDEAEFARRALQRIPGTEATQAFLLSYAIDDHPPAMKAAILTSLGERGDAMALPAVAEAIDHENSAIQQAAIWAAGALAQPADSPEAHIQHELLNLAKSSAPRVEREALDALARMADRWMQMGDVEAAERLYRRMHMQRDHALMRMAGLSGLIQIEQEEALPLLMEALKADHAGYRGLALDRLVRMPGEEITQTLVDELGEAEGMTRVTFAQIIERRDDAASAQAAPHLIAMLSAGESAVRNAAQSALTKLPGESPTQTLIEAAQESEDAVQAHIIEILGARGDAQAMPYLKEAAQQSNPTVQAAAFGALSQVGDVSMASLVKEGMQSDNGAVRNQAARAALRVANHWAEQGNEDEALELTMMAFNNTNNAGLTNEIRDLLVKLGAEDVLAKLAAQSGFITNWWAAGPVPGREQLHEENAVDPSASIDVDSPIAYQDESYQWRFFQVTEPSGQLVLEDTVGSGNNVGAYLYAVVECDEAMDVTLHFGSDDDFTAWLNGEQVAQFEGTRSWSADQNQAEATLQEGKNEILLEVLNSAGGWGASVRITDRDGNRLQLPQAKP